MIGDSFEKFNGSEENSGGISAYYFLLCKWINRGSKVGRGEERCTGISADPKDVILCFRFVDVEVIV